MNWFSAVGTEASLDLHIGTGKTDDMSAVEIANPMLIIVKRLHAHNTLRRAH